MILIPLLIAELFKLYITQNSVLMGKEKISKKDQNLLLNKFQFSLNTGLIFLEEEKNII